MGEHPLKAYTKKKDSSITVGFRMLKEKKIGSFSSAGNSGAMIVGSIYSTNVIPGIIRPCTSAILPKENGGITILLDVGTNPDPKPDVMYQFAILGSIYAQHVHGIENPKVGLLNIGEEEEKGNLLSQTAFQIMKGSKVFNFIGNIEGRDFLKDKADVIVCDGFTGNVVLKQIESMYRFMTKRGITDNYVNRFNYENYGGTPILGINSSVVVGHGISSALAIKNMLLLSKEIHEAGLSQKIQKVLRK
jgi:glycerol-3-phosphate acyltransferase PlsX